MKTMSLIARSLGLIILLNIRCGYCENSSDNENTTELTELDETEISLTAIKWSYVSFPLIFSSFMFVVAMITVVGHHLHKVTTYIPETCILIILGVIAAGILRATGSDFRTIQMVDSRTFLLFILPPIVLDAAFSLNSRDFANNIGTILLFAVVGTLINFVVIGPVLYGLSLIGAMGDLHVSMLECLLFAALIVAVDPVAVIAIFKDVGVNDMLYFLVFGESLLNDAVTLVLYNTISEFMGGGDVTMTQVGLGVASFIISSIGGAVVGIVFGLITSFITQFTYKASSIEPMIVVILAYLSYLVCELLDWSAIIALTVCGISQAQIAFANLSFESELATKRFATFLGSVFEAFIFLALGAEIVEARYAWNTGFVLLSVFLVLLGRIFSVFGLSAVVNLRRFATITLKDQFIIWYGGLRGALAFALCSTIPSTSMSPAVHDLLMTTTIVVILFTVFVQGVTMRPMVSLCGIELKDPEYPKILAEIELMASDCMMSGLEIISGHHGRNYFSDFSYRFDDVVKRVLSKHPSTRANILKEALEIRALEECSSIRERCLAKERSLCCCSIRRRDHYRVDPGIGLQPIKVGGKPSTYGSLKTW